jgi:predicted nucleotidyltransferase
MDNIFLSFTMLGVSKKLLINYRIIFEEIKKLEKKGLIKIEKIGNSNSCTFVPLFTPETFLVELEKCKTLIQDKNVQTIYKRVMEVNSPFSTFLIFGSHANFLASKNSDIDLCVIIDDQLALKKFQSSIELLPFNIHLISFSSEEFISMIKTNENNVGKEIVKNRIILKGEQSFYEMIRND